MIAVDNVTKNFGSQQLFDGVSFKINSRERVGLVGRNGHGKTTLFRLITGQDQPDSGTITIPRNYRIGYVQQHLDFTQNTVLKEGVRGLPRGEEHNHWKVEKILAGLGFSTGDMNRHPGEFSGGFQVRLNLAKVLVSEPDLLLLDEPTNYLDITSIRWIEGFLLTWPRELMLITHDRTFMDKIVTHTIGIHRKKVRRIPGNTEKYYAQIAQDEEIYEKTRINDERRRKDIEQFITRFRAKARLANLVQSRVKTLSKMEKRDKIEHIKTLDFLFRYQPFSGRHIMTCRDISFSYDPKKPLIQDFSIAIKNRDHVCVVGQNGKGKTTLLRLLAGALKAQGGEIIIPSTVKRGFYEQTNVKTLIDSRSVLDEITFSYEQVDNQLARGIAGAMMFEGDAALKKIEVLSGGEKSRVMLGKLLATPVNVLLLDEPSNHLDMESCDALLAAIDNFDGAVVMVTHNEMFLHGLAERLIVFQNERPRVFEGSYQRFLEKGGWGDEEPLLKAPGQKKTTGDKISKKEARRRRSEIISERGRVLKPIEKRIEKVEHEIQTHEKLLHDSTEEMGEASRAQDGARIKELSQTINTCQDAIDRFYNELEELTDTYEQQKELFEQRLQEEEDSAGC